MKRDYIDFQDQSVPVGYLITSAVTAHGYTAMSAARLIVIIEPMALQPCNPLR